MTGLPTTQQARAKHAWETVTNARQSANWDDFGNHVRSLGPRIVTAGLGPAVAFIAAKQTPDFLLLKCLSAWLLRHGDAKQVNRDLRQAIMLGNSDDLRRWTAEALEWLVWVKRFAEAEEKVPGSGTKLERKA